MKSTLRRDCWRTCTRGSTRTRRFPAPTSRRTCSAPLETNGALYRLPADLPAGNRDGAAGDRRRGSGLDDGGVSGYCAGASGADSGLCTGRRSVHAAAAAAPRAGGLRRLRGGRGAFRFAGLPPPAGAGAAAVISRSRVGPRGASDRSGTARAADDRARAGL